MWWVGSVLEPGQRSGQACLVNSQWACKVIQLLCACCDVSFASCMVSWTGRGHGSRGFGKHVRLNIEINLVKRSFFSLFCIYVFCRNRTSLGTAACQVLRQSCSDFHLQHLVFDLISFQFYINMNYYTSLLFALISRKFTLILILISRT